MNEEVTRIVWGHFPDAKYVGAAETLEAAIPAAWETIPDDDEGEEAKRNGLPVRYVVIGKNPIGWYGVGLG